MWGVGLILGVVFLFFLRVRTLMAMGLTIAVGCTGGRHRSVHVACRLAESLREAGWPVALGHRDLGADALPPRDA